MRATKWTRWLAVGPACKTLGSLLLMGVLVLGIQACGSESSGKTDALDAEVLDSTLDAETGASGDEALEPTPETSEPSPDIQDPEIDAVDVSPDLPPVEGPYTQTCEENADCRIACGQGDCYESNGVCFFVPQPGYCVLPYPEDTALVECYALGQANPSEGCLFCQPALAQDRWTGTIWYDDLEQDDGAYVTQDFSGSGISWHRSTRRAARGSWSLYLGDEDSGSYSADLPVDSVISWSLTLPDQAELWLRFDLWMETEATDGYDQLRVVLLDADGMETDLFDSNSIAGETGGIFRKLRLDIAPWAGQDVALRFRFETVDAKINQFEGVYLDEIELWSGCCTGDSQCDDLDPCTNEHCADGGGCAWEAIPGCCAADSDCQDDDPCTLDACVFDGDDPAVGGVCEHEQVEECCELDGDCDDGNDCTDDVCPFSGASCRHLTTCCAFDKDCEDEDPCTEGICQQESCRYVDICCHANSDCDDGELCTKDLCQADGSCLHKPAYLPGCCVPDIFDEDFDGGVGDWTFSGGDGNVGWNYVTTLKSASAPGALYYGDPATLSYDSGGSGSDDPWDWSYGYGNEGDATSGKILLPYGMAIELSFALWIDAEGCCDNLSLFIDDGAEEFRVWESGSSTTTKEWTTIRVDVSALAGRSVTLRLNFDADSSVFYEGAYVDDLRFTTTCGPKLCGADSECKSYGSCWDSECSAGVCQFKFNCCASVEDCDDQDPCTIDACTDGKCGYDEIHECCVFDSDCDDGNPCTQDKCPGEAEFCEHTPQEGCCLNDGDCDDGDGCSYDLCQELVCLHPPRCCAGNEDCDDGDDMCTADLCVGGSCSYEPTWLEECCYPLPFYETFDSGDESVFTFSGGNETVGWNYVTDLMSTSGDGALYYGNPEAFSYQTSGSLSGNAISTPVLLPAMTENTLTFDFWQSTEGSATWDYLEVYVRHGDEDYLVWKKKSSTAQETWIQLSADLSVFAGEEVQLRFYFWADGSVFKKGVVIDEVKIESACAPKACEGASDCPVYGECWTSACVEGTCDFTFNCCADDSDCEDLDPCTTGSCEGTLCEFSFTEGCCRDDGECSDGDICTEDQCSEPGGECLFPAIANCCHAHGECDDGDACTMDLCLDYQCAHQDECCVTDSDCDDGDELCTNDSCVEGRCAFTPTEVEGCCVALPFARDFSEDAAELGLEVSEAMNGVGWSVVSAPPSEGEAPDAMLYYGDPAAWSYDSGGHNTGSAVLSGIELHEDVAWGLSFRVRLDVSDPGAWYDRLQLELRVAPPTPGPGEEPAAPESYIVWSKEQIGSLGEWEDHSLDISAFAGKQVDLVFTFDTKDGTYNIGSGAWIDELSISGSCQPRPCLEDEECLDGLPVSVDLCVESRCQYSLP